MWDRMSSLSETHRFNTLGGRASVTFHCSGRRFTTQLRWAAGSDTAEHPRHPRGFRRPSLIGVTRTRAVIHSVVISCNGGTIRQQYLPPSRAPILQTAVPIGPRNSSSSSDIGPRDEFRMFHTSCIKPHDFLSYRLQGFPDSTIRCRADQRQSPG